MKQSREWYVVFDLDNHREIVAEFPVDGRDRDVVRAEISKRFPDRRYSVGSYSLGRPEITAIPEAKSWEASDYFSDMIENEREKRQS